MLRERARCRAAVDGDGGEKGGWAGLSKAQNGFPGSSVRPPGRAGPRSRSGPSRRRAHRGRSVLTVTAGPPRRPGRAGPSRPLAPLPQHNGGGARPPGCPERPLPAPARTAAARAGPAEGARRGRSPERSLRAGGAAAVGERGRELENLSGSGRIPFSASSSISRDIRIVFHVQPENCNTLFEFSVCVTFSSLPEPCKLIPLSLVSGYTWLSVKDAVGWGCWTEPSQRQSNRIAIHFNCIEATVLSS